MVKSDRQALLEAMEERHAALVDEIDALQARVDMLLLACGAAPQSAANGGDAQGHAA